MENYIVVQHHHISVVVEIVNEKINEGYIPIGGIAGDRGSFYQAMILKK